MKKIKKSMKKKKKKMIMMMMMNVFKIQFKSKF